MRAAHETRNACCTRRPRRRLIFLTLCCGPFVLQDPVHGTSYTTTLLHPAGFSSSEALDVSGNYQVGYASNLSSGGDPKRGLLWNNSAGSAVELTPPRFTKSQALAIAGDRLAGWASGPDVSCIECAFLWNGSATNFVNLHPATFSYSEVQDLDASHEFGTGYFNDALNVFRYHALLWSGTAESVVDLNPTGFTESRGMALAENRQVGQGRSPTATGNLFHALLWQGSANSYVDLNPTGFNASIANGIWGNYQVGNGLTTSLQTHALLWNGTAGSFVDLNPPEYSSSIAYDVWAENQVGKGSGTATGGMDHALLWHGTAASVVDLHPFLSGLSITMTRSEARAVDAQGTITGTAFDASGTRYAVLWTPIIEAGAGDFNGDNKVDGRDFLSWQRGSSPESYSSVDLGAWSANYGREAWQVVGVPVPEPSGALITVMLGMLTVCSHASRSRCVYARNP